MSLYLIEGSTTLNTPSKEGSRQETSLIFTFVAYISLNGIRK